MAEGGLLPWKMQKISSRGPTADYSGLRKPLPKLPDGMIWHQDKGTKEWSPVKEEEKQEKQQQQEKLDVFSASDKEPDLAKEKERDLDIKIQRTTSSSPLDSTDNVLGPSGLGVLGVDYVEHVILPTDTFQGICLAYKINTTRLRQANRFSGSSLLLAPKKLIIPLSEKALRSGFIMQDTDAKEYKLHAFLEEFADLSLTEAKA
jgi:hypothetical protein